MGNLLFKTSTKINDKITINVPKIGDIVDNEDSFFSIITILTATPYDLMVQLDDIGIDFSKIDEWELFCLLFNQLKEMDMSLIFGDLDFKQLNTAINQNTKQTVIVDNELSVVIDRAVYHDISKVIREILYLEEQKRKAANEEAKKYLIDKERRKQQSLARKRKLNGETSKLQPLIIALVNSSEFGYSYDSIKDLTIFQFYSSLHQIIRKVKFDNTMIGCYTGNIKTSELPADDLSWIKLNDK